LSPDELLTKKDLEKFKEELFGLLKDAQNLKQQKWLRSKDVRDLLKISAGTLQNLRVSGVLIPHKVGKIFFYKAEDIDKMLNNPEKKA
jgi:hypothetical protein